nr:GtrA family protein [Brucella intermedia]
MLKQFPLFASGSAIGAIVDYVVTLFASHHLDLCPAVALALSMIISGTTVFFFHVHLTYRDTTGSLFRRYILFMS